MITSDFTTTIVVDQSPKEAFKAIVNPEAWWSEEITGGTSELGDEFSYHYEDVHSCRMKLSEVAADKKVVWDVLENYFKFTKDQSEWLDTQVIFEISERETKTEIKFTHKGLVPEHECYDICKNAWTQYIQESLFNLITTGKGQPNGKGKPTTPDEERLGAVPNNI